MKAILTRSGGFAGIGWQREIEVDEQQLSAMRGASERLPDAFQYELTVNGETFPVSEDVAGQLLGRAE